MITVKEPFALSCVGDHLTITLRGEIDHHSAAPLREAIDRELYRYRPHRFTLSLASVNFMDSSGLGLVLGRLEVCREMGCAMCLTHAGERTLRIFRMARLDRVAGLRVEGLTE